MGIGPFGIVAQDGFDQTGPFEKERPFERGQQAPLPLFPRISWAFAETIVSPPKRPPANPPWLKEWDGKDDEEGRGEKREPHIALAFRNVPEPLGDQWEKCAREIYLPILRSRRQL